MAAQFLTVSQYGTREHNPYIIPIECIPYFLLRNSKVLKGGVELYLRRKHMHRRTWIRSIVSKLLTGVEIPSYCVQSPCFQGTLVMSYAYK